jgi:hypothetical protein
LLIFLGFCVFQLCVAHLFSFYFAFSYYVSLRSEFLVVMFVTISAYILCSIRLYLQLFVWGSCLIYVRFVFTFQLLVWGSCLIYVICVCLTIVVSNTYAVFLCCFPLSWVPYVASFGEEQIMQWLSEKVQKDKQWSTKHFTKTKDWVKRTHKKPGSELM